MTEKGERQGETGGRGTEDGESDMPEHRTANLALY